MKIYLIIFYCLFNSILGAPHEARLLKQLFIEDGYNKLERPVRNDSDSVNVDIKLTLNKIIDFDTKQQVLTTYGWLTMIWQDSKLIWTPEDYGNIQSIRVPNTKIWIPDIYLYNSLDEKLINPTETNVVVLYTGQVLYVSSKIFKSVCAVNTISVPFFLMNIYPRVSKTQTCMLKFGSWTYDSAGINLTPSAEEIDVSAYVQNFEWDLKNTSVVRTTEKYDCCPEIYQDVRFNMKIVRRSANDLTDVLDLENSNDSNFSNQENQQNDTQV